MKTPIDLSSSLASAVEKVGPSIVRVEGRSRGTSSGVVWSEDGLVVTVEHSLDRDEGIEVGLPDGTTVDAALVGRDPLTDVAVLRVKATGLVPLAWADATTLKVGQLALATARPGKSVRAALGIISALGPSGQTFRTPHGGKLERYVETDLAPRLGFSGGAVLDSSGQAIGLHTTGLLRGSSLAQTKGTLQKAADGLLAHGGIRRAFLGVGTYPVRLPEAMEKQLGQGSALLVVSVAGESPAQRSGVLMGDLLVSLSGQPLRHMGDLLTALDEDQIGQEAPLKIVRAGEGKDLRITIGARA